MNKKLLPLLATLLVGFISHASAQYQGWRHSGPLCILTTPEGANLPATAVEEGFPLLVRLNREWFDFQQAQAGGEDVRFAAEGKPLAYQIDDWDATAGTACIWVRIPVIKGNALQEIKMFWGKADAKSESDGKAVFNNSNGYVGVWHMNDPVKDEVGTAEANDSGTTSSAGMIGKARHFDPSKGIECGKNVTTYPVSNDPHSSELWARTESVNGGVLLWWGVDKPGSLVRISFARPPHVRVDCWNSAAGINNESQLQLSQWIHVLYVFKKGDARMYVNGRPDGSRTGDDVALTIGSPAEVKLGAGQFSGDIDEVRVSKVARSADWAKLQFENQKPLQTVVGTLPWPGTGFSVLEKRIELSEGKSIKLTAKAGGARKVFWIVKRGEAEVIADVDRLEYTVAAGRVTGDTAFTLQLKAVFADQVKTLDIPVTIKEDIPDPVFTLQAPATWNGRDRIEVVPRIANLSALQAKGVGELKVDWGASGIAVIKEVADGKLLLKRSQNSGKLTVSATASNGGSPVTHAVEIQVKEPAKDEWVQRTPDKDEKPADNQFYARDDKNEGTLHYNGTLTNQADSVFLRLYADDKLVKTESQKPKADKSYAFAVKLKAGLVKYKVEFGTKNGAAETIQQTVNNLVCGDAYFIDGQSNAVAYNYHNNTKRPDLVDFTSDWIRTYGSGGEAGEDTTNGRWGNAVLTNVQMNGRGGVHFIGVWGMVIAKQLVDDQKIPICIFNAAVGGTRIDQHLPDPVDRLNTTDAAHSIYRNLLRRATAARLTHGIRGMLWHQGEADQGYDGPDNCYGCETYQQYWVDLTAAWKQDFPNLRNYYVYQIWPNACSQGGNRHSDMLRDVQRCLLRLYAHLSVMPTLDLPSGQSCHFVLEDYEKMGLRMVPLIERDACGKAFTQSITAPDLKSACFTTDRKDEIVLDFGQPVTWIDALASQFYLGDEAGKVASGAVSGNVLTLKLTAPATAKTITYLTDRKWDPKTLLYGRNGLAALTFCEVPIGIRNE